MATCLAFRSPPWGGRWEGAEHFPLTSRGLPNARQVASFGRSQNLCKYSCGYAGKTHCFGTQRPAGAGPFHIQNTMFWSQSRSKTSRAPAPAGAGPFHMQNTTFWSQSRSKSSRAPAPAGAGPFHIQNTTFGSQGEGFRDVLPPARLVYKTQCFWTFSQ